MTGVVANATYDVPLEEPLNLKKKTKKGANKVNSPSKKRKVVEHKETNQFDMNEPIEE